MTLPESDFHDDEITTSYADETSSLCEATPACAAPGSFSDAQGHPACREHGGVAPRNFTSDVRRLLASAATRRDYATIARILGDADVDLAWLAEELQQTTRRRAHPLALDLVRLGVEPHLLVPSLPPAAVAESPRAQLRRDRVARAVRALHCGPTVDAVPNELRDCYRRHGEVLCERDRLQRRLALEMAKRVVQRELATSHADDLARALHDERRATELAVAERDALRQRVAELERKLADSEALRRHMQMRS